MDKKQVPIIIGALILFTYLTSTSIIENKETCRQDADCSLVEAGCCQGEREYACFENTYSWILKFKNLRCSLLSNGNCSSEFKTLPECICQESRCIMVEKNDTAFTDQLKNLSYEPPKEAQWGN